MKGMIAAGHELTAAAGAEVLREGGNAFDAAVAASFASFFCESALTSAGGGGFLMGRTSSGEVRLYDFFTDVPGRGRPESHEGIDFFSVIINFANQDQELHIGRGSAAVPGVVAGLEAVYKNHCTLPLTTLLAPAIAYARQGIELSPYQADFNSILSPMLMVSDESRAYYAPSGEPVKSGELIRSPAMADTFEYLAAEGLRRFYDGEIAGKILEGFGGQTGFFTEEDLAGYRVAVRDPLHLRYKDRTIYTNPPPSSGGTLISFALKLIEGMDAGKLGHNTFEYLRLLSNVMGLTHEARRKRFDERRYEPGIAVEFLSEENVAEYKKRLGTYKGPDASGGGAVELGPGNTTQISIVDKEGNAATITTSTGIGCGFMIPGTNIMMNNMLGEEDLNPHGFHVDPPGLRMSSMMSPTIVVRDDSPEIVLGSGGSKRIRDAIFQVVLNIMEHGMLVEDAVNAARVHLDDTGLFHVEKDVDEGVKDSLDDAGLNLKRWDRKHMFFGGVHTVVTTPEGLSGSGDGRRGGVSTAGG